MKKRTSPKADYVKPDQSTLKRVASTVKEYEKSPDFISDSEYLSYDWVMEKVFAQMPLRVANALNNTDEESSPNHNRKHFDVGRTYYHIACRDSVKCITHVKVMAHLEDDLFFVDYYDGYSYGMCCLHLGTGHTFEFLTYKLAQKTLDEMLAKDGANGDGT